MNLRRITSLELTLLKEEKGDQLANMYSTLNRWKKHYCQLLNILCINDVTQTEIHTAEKMYGYHQVGIKFQQN